MARHTDNDHNVWYDGVTLTNCQYVHVKDGCTGTITDCRFVEIGENNVNISFSDVSYCTMEDNNRNITVSDSDYLILGSDCENVTIGSHDPNNKRFFGRIGGNSIVVGHKTIGAEITGYNSEYDKSSNVQADGTFNNVVKSGVVFLDNANGNGLKNSSRVDLTETNNNALETVNINLEQKASFIDYATVNKALMVKQLAPMVNRQSDANGDILDVSLNILINKKNGTKDTTHWTKINGIWVEVSN